MHRLITSVGLAVVLVGLGPVHEATAQEIASASYERGPRFLLALATKVVPVNVSRTPVLARRLNLELEGATIKQALAEIAAQSGLVLAYSDDAVPLEKRVHLRAEVITAAAALTDVLFDAGVDVVFKADGSAALVKRPPTPQNGSVSGRVTDATTGAAIVGATVVIERTSLSATTGNDGRYRIAEVPVGTYTVRARYIGYAPGSASVTVAGAQEATADLVVEKSAQRLDEVVTTGTLIPTEVKALPTPVTVITAKDIEQQPSPRMTQIFRRAVPGAVAVDFSTFPQQTPLSVRGAASLTGAGGSGTIKVYLDGIEVANRTVAAVDPNSIERIEVIRGPQAAAIYGSDAIGGVMQVFTKRGDASMARPQVDVQAAAGLVQGPYETEPNRGFRQEYSVGVRGGVSAAGYSVGGGFSRTGAWLPDYFLSSPSAYGAVTLSQGPITFDLSARYFSQVQNRDANPLLEPTGYLPFSRPYFRRIWSSEETYGARITYAARQWWSNTLTVGVDRWSYDEHSTRPRLTSPADTFLFVNLWTDRKPSIAYNTSFTMPLGRPVSAALIAGFDHRSLSHEILTTSTATTIDGNISPAQGTRSVTTNTGYFAQAQVGFRDALFLTGALRADENSDFGAALRTPLSPRGGVSAVHSFGGTTLKVRASYGKAINPPGQGQKSALEDASRIILANPVLAPEQQKGVDGGIDLVLGTRATVSLTGYSQIATGLIQFILVDPVTAPVTFQYQNVGRVKNTGLEVEAEFNVASIQLSGNYAYTRSRVEELGPEYTGDLRVGDQVLGVPRHTASGSLAVTPLRSLSVATYVDFVGERTQTDFVALLSCFGGTQPCRPSGRDYIITYPSYTKLGVSVTYRMRERLTAFLTVDNVANHRHDELGNLGSSSGRATLAGLRLTGLQW